MEFSQLRQPEFQILRSSEAEEITLRLAESATQENVLILKYSENLIDELSGLEKSKKTFDLIIVDCSEPGFLFPCEILAEASDVIKSLLAVLGSLVLVKQDKAMALVKETAAGYLSFHMFSTFSAVYDYSSAIANHIQQAMGQGVDLHRDSADLSEQILMTVIPVLTNFGIKLKAGMDSSKRRNMVLSAIDNYSPLSSITQRLAEKLSFDETLEELKGLEKTGAIYPIFPKIPFLVQQFRHTKSFTIKDYLLESRLLSREQLDEVISSMQNSKGSQRLSLGAFCVARGLLSARQLEIVLQDQSFFGQRRDHEKNKIRIEAEQHSKSLVGNLSTTDPAGVLQNLSSNRSSGVLSVEYKDLTFKALFEMGKLAYAKTGKIKGNKAVTEFVSVWKDGVYVFIERLPPPDLANEECKISKPLDKLLLDSALAADNTEAVWKKLNKAEQSQLEKLPDKDKILQSTSLVDPQENYPLNADELRDMNIFWSNCDGLSTISDIIKKCDQMSTVQAALAINRLLHYQLIRVPSADLPSALAKFRSLLTSVSERIGTDKSDALLRISLRESQGYTSLARVFTIGSSYEIGVDLSAAKASALSLSTLVKALEDWQVKYIEHASQELDKNVLREIVYRIHK